VDREFLATCVAGGQGLRAAPARAVPKLFPCRRDAARVCRGKEALRVHGANARRGRQDLLCGVSNGAQRAGHAASGQEGGRRRPVDPDGVSQGDHPVRRLRQARQPATAEAAERATATDCSLVPTFGICAPMSRSIAYAIASAAWIAAPGRESGPCPPRREARHGPAPPIARQRPLGASPCRVALAVPTRRLFPEVPDCPGKAAPAAARRLAPVNAEQRTEATPPAAPAPRKIPADGGLSQNPPFGHDLRDLFAGLPPPHDCNAGAPPWWVGYRKFFQRAASPRPTTSRMGQLIATDLKASSPCSCACCSLPG